MTDSEQKKIFAKNLTSLLSSRNKTQKEVADAIGVSPQTFNTWCQGIALPRMGKVQKLADYFSISKSDLIDEKINRSQKKGVRIPVFGDVAAGVPLEMIEDVDDWEEITEEMALQGDYFALRIRGNSMEPRMREGDVVICRQQQDADSGQLVIVTVNGDSATCKRLKKYPDGLALLSTNPAFEPMYFNAEEIEKKPVRIIARVVELRAKF